MNNIRIAKEQNKMKTWGNDQTERHNEKRGSDQTERHDEKKTTKPIPRSLRTASQA